MDDFEHPFDQFPYFPGVDLTLWVQLLVALLLVAAGGALLAGYLG